MENIEMRVEGSKLIIEIELDNPRGPTGNRKNMSLATTGGAIPTVDAEGKFRDEKVNINVYRPFRAGESREPKRDD